MYANSHIATGHVLFGSGLGIYRCGARCRGASAIALPLASLRETHRTLMMQSPTRLSDLWFHRGSLFENDKWERLSTRRRPDSAARPTNMQQCGKGSRSSCCQLRLGLRG